MLLPAISFAILDIRTPAMFKTAHIRMGDDGDLWCLDVDVHASDRDQLVKFIRETVAWLKRDELLRGAPREAWQSIQGGVVDRVERILCPNAKFQQLQLVYVRPTR